MDRNGVLHTFQQMRRALTVHAREQRKGETDKSVQQTRRMYLACENAAKWRGAWDRAKRSAAYRKAV